MMRLHWYYAAHDTTTSLIYTKHVKAGRKGGKEPAAVEAHMGAHRLASAQALRPSRRWLPVSSAVCVS
jgi:hypothetical protein